MCGRQRGKASIRERERERVLCKVVQALLVWGGSFVCGMMTDGWFEHEHTSRIEAIEDGMDMGVLKRSVFQSLNVTTT